MGTYLNPGNGGFTEILNKKYVDKTGLIALMNQRINTPDKLVCISRPRRFGKSFAAKMLCAYYDCTCDSRMLFEKWEIGQHDDFDNNMNAYNVIYLDMAGIISKVKRTDKTISTTIDYISAALLKDLAVNCPELEHIGDVSDCIREYVAITGRKFVFVIDEWDAIIREAKDDEVVQEAYLDLLREWFKNNNFTPDVVALTYMTGILPIKKDGSQSAISDFKEFTFLSPGEFTKYTGFTEQEVKELCDEYQADYEKMKSWYDGYEFEAEGSIYNPYSVMETLELGEYELHWQKTSVAENLITYINMDKEGLQTDILKLLAGEHTKVNTRGFHNDFEHFNSKDDVLTLLIHLGYLSYNKETRRIRIPNEEVKLEFMDILEHPKHTRLADLIQTSEQLLNDTLAGNEAAVANAISKIRETNYAPQYYNNEQALRYAVKFAYIVCVDRFMKIEELPSGRGIADLVFVPGRDTAYPALVIELKWDQESEDALAQVNDKKYAAVLEGYYGEIVKVGISYNTDSKEHSCRIEKI